MTVFADIGGADVVEVFTGRGYTIMAVATTLGRNVLMIKIRRYPAGGTMTVVALCCSGQVIKIPAHGSDAIVAT